MPNQKRIAVTMDPVIEAALTHQSKGEFAAAEKIYREFLSAHPDDIPAQHFLGLLHFQQGSQREGIAEMQQAIQTPSDFIQAYLNLGQAFAMSNLTRRALDCYMEAVLIDTKNLKALQGYAESHRALGNIEEYTKAMGHIAFFRGDYKSALANYKYCLEHCKADRTTEFNMAVCYKVIGRWEEAHAIVKKYLAEDENDVELNYLDADLLLGMGQYQEGWKKYESRFDHMGNEINCRRFAEPEWDGSPLRGRTLLLHKEQGSGDMLQFIRYVSMVAKDGGKILVEALPSMHSLFALLPNIDMLVEYDKRPFPAHDVQLSLMSLPRIFNTDLATIPAKAPYFPIPNNLVEKLSTNKKLKIGIAWTGSKKHNYNHLRTMPIDIFSKLFQIDNVQFYNFQFDIDPEARATLNKYGIIDLTPKINSFLDSAAYVKQLDLVVSVDTALVHLAGALNVPVWNLLSICVDWRWGRAGDKTPWYPSMRLWRQHELNEWDELLARVKKQLASLAN